MRRVNQPNEGCGVSATCALILKHICVILPYFDKYIYCLAFKKYLYICSAVIEGGAVQMAHCPLQLIHPFLTPRPHPQTGSENICPNFEIYLTCLLCHFLPNLTRIAILLGPRDNNDCLLYLIVQPFSCQCEVEFR